MRISLPGVLAAMGLAAILTPPSIAQQDFGTTMTQLREISSFELNKPAIPDDEIAPDPGNPEIRPLYLWLRYYSVVPWLKNHVRDVFTDVVPRSEYQVEIDTAEDNPEGQLVRDINHPAFGLYCITIRICLPWDLWQPGFYPRFYVKWVWRHPYWCWIDHWWYYWRVNPTPGLPAIWCPWGPSWIPWHSWARGGDLWCLNVCHPYCYRWRPDWVPRPFCLYGLRFWCIPFPNIRVPLNDLHRDDAIPLQPRLRLPALVNRPWEIYHFLPPRRYWPFTPYCARWYWWRCLPFRNYWYNPPVAQFGIYLAEQEPTFDLPEMPTTDLPGTEVIVHTRALVQQPADINGDGLVNATDQQHFRSQQGTQAIDSFFDVFVEIDTPSAESPQ